MTEQKAQNAKSGRLCFLKHLVEREVVENCGSAYLS